MLVLSRRTDETVVINDNIRVTVIEEVWLRIQAERGNGT